MAGILGKGNGVFQLSSSDKNPGSFFKVNDLAVIFNTDASNFSHLPSETVDGEVVIDESTVQKAWYNGFIPNVQPAKVKNFSISFDEVVLAQLIKQVYPNAEVSHQVQWGRKSLDFYVKNPCFADKVVEFHGPTHFAPSRFAKEILDPQIRKEQIENDFGVECVIWPYWIQRCEANVRAIFEPETVGYGLLWSANTHFGEFVFENSADVIERITSRFNASRSGYGYFYGPNTADRSNVEHPIVEKILKGKTSAEKLIPKGATDRNFWLPERLKGL